ncbi:MAG: acyltransferase [Clostridia bacterium]|nr:acyltransferase [Clostridia bacterium]
MKKHNEVLDIIKAFAAFCVVFLHFSFPGVFGKIVFSVSRFAVPMFFAVSGYFYNKKDKSAQLASTGRKARHILLLVFVCEGLAYCNYLFNDVLSAKTFKLSMLVQVFADRAEIYKESMWRLISFTPLFNATAWFLVQLFLAYLIFGFITKKSLYKPAGIIITVCFASGILLTRVCETVKFELPNYTDYFILFMGLPFFAFGYYLKDAIPKFSLTEKLSGAVLVLMSAAGIILSIGEGFVFRNVHIYFGSILLTFTFFVIGAEYSEKTFTSRLGKALVYIGSNLTLYIYIIHPVAGSLLEKVFERLHFSGTAAEIQKYIFPLVLCAVTVAASWIVFNIVNVIKKRLKPERG